MKVDTSTMQSPAHKPGMRGMYGRYTKRLFDLIISLGLVVLLSPIFVVVALLVQFKLGSPVIFKQKRPGLNEEIFTLYKFRTMTTAKDNTGNLLPNNLRLTPFGKMLRSTSLDELPELWNIIRGEMSLVGPRPLLVDYLPFYNKRQARRHAVRPGLTGFAQIKGRNTISWEEKFNYDLWYVDNLNFWLDLKIITKTFFKVIKRHDINHSRNTIMPKFTGTKVNNCE